MPDIVPPSPAPYYSDATITLHHGDCLDILRELPDNSVDAVCTDPPYGLANTDPAHVAETITRWVNGERDYLPGGSGFMGKAWDAFVPPVAVWDDCLRVLKPGGHVLAFAGSRTVDLMTLGLRLAGFDIRDSVAWLYGSGFPKSLDVSKAIDKAAGAEREVIGQWKPTGKARLVGGKNPNGIWQDYDGAETIKEQVDITAPATPDAERWQGWGTALKPAFEPIVVARKPLSGTVAANVLAHGTGALNIDGCRVEGEGSQWSRTSGGTGMYHFGGFTTAEELTAAAANDSRTPNGERARLVHERYLRGLTYNRGNQAGRWPANVLLDESQAEALDEMSGESREGNGRTGGGNPDAQDGGVRFLDGIATTRYPGEGGASRFFYVAKADASERPFYFRPTCECEDAWPTHTPSAARATAATTEPESSSTSKSGSATTGDESPRATRSTTSTATSSTTTPTTSSQSPRPTTSASILDASSATVSGGSPADSAGSSSASASLTGISAAKGGRSTAAVARATSPAWSKTSVCGSCGAPTRREAHATVKPLALMRWLVRLVTPPGGTVLEPFAGSGTTVEACLLEGFRCVAIEREAEYLPLIRQRINRRRDPVEAVKGAGEDGGLFDLLDGGAA